MEVFRNSAARKGYPPVDRRAAETARRNFSQPRVEKFTGATAVHPEIVSQDSEQVVEHGHPDPVNTADTRSVTGVPYGGQKDGHTFDVNATHVPPAFWTEGQF